jgi:hypothetical protein
MRRIWQIIILALAIAAAPFAFAQGPSQTSVSATIVDPNGIPYANANITAQLVPQQPYTVCSSGQQYTGSGYNTGGTNTAGYFQMTLVDNTQICPGGSQWLFTINLQPGGVLPVGNGPITFTVQVTISGATQDISTQINAVAPAISKIGPGSGTVTSVSASCGLVVSPNPIIAIGTVKGSVTTQTISGSSYTFQSTDCGTEMNFTSNAGTVDANLPVSGLPAGWYASFVFLGTGQLAIGPLAGATMNGGTVYITRAAPFSGTIFYGGSGTFYVALNYVSVGTGTVTSVSGSCGATTTPSPIVTTGTVNQNEPVQTKSGSSYTFVQGDCGDLTYLSSSASTVTLTVPASGLTAGWYADFIYLGTSTLAMTPAGGATINGSSTATNLTGPYSGRIFYSGSATYYMTLTAGSGGTGIVTVVDLCNPTPYPNINCGNYLKDSRAAVNTAMAALAGKSGTEIRIAAPIFISGVVYPPVNLASYWMHSSSAGSLFNLQGTSGGPYPDLTGPLSGGMFVAMPCNNAGITGCSSLGGFANASFSYGVKNYVATQGNQSPNVGSTFTVQVDSTVGCVTATECNTNFDQNIPFGSMATLAGITTAASCPSPGCTGQQTSGDYDPLNGPSVIINVAKTSGTVTTLTFATWANRIPTALTNSVSGSGDYTNVTLQFPMLEIPAVNSPTQNTAGMGQVVQYVGFLDATHFSTNPADPTQDQGTTTAGIGTGPSNDLKLLYNWFYGFAGNNYGIRLGGLHPNGCSGCQLSSSNVATAEELRVEGNNFLNSSMIQTFGNSSQDVFSKNLQYFSKGAINSTSNNSYPMFPDGTVITAMGYDLCYRALCWTNGENQITGTVAANDDGCSLCALGISDSIIDGMKTELDPNLNGTQECQSGTAFPYASCYGIAIGSEPFAAEAWDSNTGGVVADNNTFTNIHFSTGDSGDCSGTTGLNCPVNFLGIVEFNFNNQQAATNQNGFSNIAAIGFNTPSSHVQCQYATATYYDHANVCGGSSLPISGQLCGGSACPLYYNFNPSGFGTSGSKDTISGVLNQNALTNDCGPTCPGFVVQPTGEIAAGYLAARTQGPVAGGQCPQYLDATGTFTPVACGGGSSGEPTNPQTGTTYTFQSTDCGKIVTFSNSSAMTATLPSLALGAGCAIDIANFGSGTLTLASSSGLINGSASSLNYVQFQGARLVADGTNYSAVQGHGVLGSENLSTSNAEVLVNGAGKVTQLSESGAAQYFYSTSSGPADAQILVLPVPLTVLVPGAMVQWLPVAANATTTPTLAVNGLTAKTVTKCGQSAVAASDINTTTVAFAIYDGTDWELQNPAVGCGVVGGGTSVSINGGSALTSANFNSTTPAAGANNQNITFQVSAPSVSAEVPRATASQAGLVQLATDLGGIYTAPTVVNGSHITNSSIPNSGLVNPATTVNGQTCTLGSTCTLQGVEIKTANYTLLSSDSGQTIVMNCSGACALNLLATPTNGFYGEVISIGTVTAAFHLNSTNWNGSSSAPALNSFSPLFYWSDGTNYYGSAPFVVGTGISVTPATNGITVACATGSSSVVGCFQGSGTGSRAQTTNMTSSVNQDFAGTDGAANTIDTGISYNLSADTLLGNPTGSTANVSAFGLNPGLAFSSSKLGCAAATPSVIGCVTVPLSANLLASNGTPVPIVATETNVNAVGYAAGGGTANAQTVTLAPAITSYTNGLTVYWLAAASNTTTATLNVNGLGAINIMKVPALASLVANDIRINNISWAIYDGTEFVLQNPQTNISLTTGVTGVLPTANGGSATSSTLTGVMRGGNPFTAAELSGDCTTSGSNATTCLTSNGNPTQTLYQVNTTNVPVSGVTGAQNLQALATPSGALNTATKTFHAHWSGQYTTGVTTGNNPFSVFGFGQTLCSQASATIFGISQTNGTWEFELNGTVTTASATVGVANIDCKATVEAGVTSGVSSVFEITSTTVSSLNTSGVITLQLINTLGNAGTTINSRYGYLEGKN